VTNVATGIIPRDSGIGALEVLLNLTTEQAERIMGSVSDKKPVEEPNPYASPRPPVPPQQPEKCGCSVEKTHKNLPKHDNLVKCLKKFFNEQRKDVLGSLKKTYDDAHNKGIKAKLPSKFVDLADWDSVLYEDAQPIIQLTLRNQYEKTAKDLMVRAGVSPDHFNVTGQHLNDKCHKLALNFCKETNATTSMELQSALDKTREEIAEGLTSGDRMTDLVARVEGVFDRASTDRAELIAQTESSRAHHEGLRQSAKDSDVVSGFKLLPASECCQQCTDISAEGGDIGLDDYFTEDKTAPPEYVDRFVPIHPGCCCSVECCLKSGAQPGDTGTQSAMDDVVD
jgi:hypothetical protein